MGCSEDSVHEESCVPISELEELADEWVSVEGSGNIEKHINRNKNRKRIRCGERLRELIEEYSGQGDDENEGFD